MNAQAPTTRTRAEIRTNRFTVMSAALDLFRTRRTNTARRDKWLAAEMRFAGEEARFCIAEAKYRLSAANAAATLQESIRRSRADLAARMTPEQRENRVRAILAEIEALPYRPLSVNIRKVEAQLREELVDLQVPPTSDKPVSDPVKLGIIAAMSIALDQGGLSQ